MKKELLIVSTEETALYKVVTSYDAANSMLEEEIVGEVTSYKMSNNYLTNGFNGEFDKVGLTKTDKSALSLPS